MLGWILIVIFLLAGLFSYFNGVKKQKHWGWRMLAVCAGALYVLLLPRLTTVLAIALFAGAIVSYLAGVRKVKTWGRPVLVLCVIGLLGTVLYRALPHRYSGSGGRSAYESGGSKAARLMGKELKGTLRAGSRVLMVGGSPPAGAGQLPDEVSEWKAAFSKGLGDDSWELVGYEGSLVALTTALGLSQAIASKAGGIDVLLVFGGLPEDLTEGDFYKRQPRPVVGAYFAGHRPVDWDAVRRWLNEGYVRVIVADKEGALSVYTPTNLPMQEGGGEKEGEAGRAPPASGEAVEGLAAP